MFFSFRFEFDHGAPTFADLQQRMSEQTGDTYAIEGHCVVARRGGGASSVTLDRGKRAITVHSDLNAGDVYFHVRRALESLGGRHPPIIAQDCKNPNYGESWLGILAEDDDWVFRAGGRRFTIWSAFLNDIWEAPEADWAAQQARQLCEMNDYFFDHKSMRMDIESAIALLTYCCEIKYRPTWQEHSRIAFLHLTRFLEAARSEGCTSIEISEE